MNVLAELQHLYANGIRYTQLKKEQDYRKIPKQELLYARISNNQVSFDENPLNMYSDKQIDTLVSLAEELQAEQSIFLER